MQPQPQEELYAEQQHSGVVYGYVALGSYGDELIYYFGRSKQAAMYNMSLEGVQAEVHERQKKLLKDRCRRAGLSAPSRVLLWGRSTDVDKDWDSIKDFLKGNRWAPGHPLITNELWVGDNWFTVESLGPEGFGRFVRTVWNTLHSEEEQVPVGEEEGAEEEEQQSALIARFFM